MKYNLATIMDKLGMNYEEQLHIQGKAMIFLGQDPPLATYVTVNRDWSSAKCILTHTLTD